MSIDFLVKKERQTRLIIILAVVLVIIVIVVVRGLTSKESIINYALTTKESGIISSQEINIDLNIFNNPIFEKLESFTKIAPLKGDAGRINPFIPYR